MKTLNEVFEDKDFEAMKEFKENLSWRDFILIMFIHCKKAKRRGDFDIYKT